MEPSASPLTRLECLFGGKSPLQAHPGRRAVTEWCRKFLTLEPRTRIWIGLGIIGYAGIGTVLSNGAEKQFGMVATEEDKERLRKAVPRITTVDRDKD